VRGRGRSHVLTRLNFKEILIENLKSLPSQFMNQASEVLGRRNLGGALKKLPNAIIWGERKL
jgi:hypothetical protein